MRAGDVPNLVATMSSETVDIKPLDGTAVLCQGEGCDQPALYLFCAATRTPSYAAYCERHARQFANRISLALPPTKRAEVRQW